MVLVEYCCLISLSSLGDSEMLHQQFVRDKNFVGWGRKLMEAKKIDMPCHIDNNKVIIILENNGYYLTYGWVVPDLNIRLWSFGSCLEGGCRRPVNEEGDRPCMLL